MFLILLFVMLLLICIGLIAYLVSLSQGLKKAAAVLRDHIQNKTTARLNVPCPNRSAEELLQQINRLAELRQEEHSRWVLREQSIRQQIANVSHDLRTPLTSILGYVQLLEREDLAPKQRMEYLTIIEGRARTLQSFIGSFYELSRIEGGEWPLERERVDLVRILSDLLAETYEQLENAGLRVEPEFPPDLPPVWADRNAATRVFSNLLTNALRHGRGTLSVSLRREGQTLVSSFSNEAADMTQEDAEHVFERFYVATKARERESTGLGLAIVKALSDRMGCTATAHCSGGIFTIEIIWPV